MKLLAVIKPNFKYVAYYKTTNSELGLLQYIGCAEGDIHLQAYHSGWLVGCWEKYRHLHSSMWVDLIQKGD